MTDIQPHFKPRVAFAFTPTDVHNFTEGDCWILAHAIREITGWDVVAVGSQAAFDAATRPREREWSHMLVRHPSGMLLDITGAYTDEEIVYNLYGYIGMEGLTYTANDPEDLDAAGTPTFGVPARRVESIARSIIHQSHRNIG